MMLAALDSSIVNTALPRMVTDLGGLIHLSWVVTAFMLSSTITTPLYGKLSDTFGRRHMFGVSIIIFLLGSVFCGAAQTMAQLIGFRALQGLGAGGLLVLAQAAIGDVVAPRDRPRYQGLFTGVFAVASVAGPLLGGIITQALSWRWIFYVNLPIGAIALAMIWRGLPPKILRADGSNLRSIDYAGTILLTLVTTTILLLLAGGGSQFPWVSRNSFCLALFAIVLLALFLWREAIAPQPLIRLPLFRNTVFARGTLVSGMASFAMFGTLVLMPVYFQLVLGMSPAQSGEMILPQVGCMFVSSIIGGRFVSRDGRYRLFLIAGIWLEASALAGLAGLAFIGAPPILFLVAVGILGCGMGMFMPNLTNAVQNAVTHAELGAATGTMVFIRSLGGAAGVAASGAIMSSRLANANADVTLHALTQNGLRTLGDLSIGQQAAISNAYRSALAGCFTLSGIVMIAALVLVLGLPEIQLRTQIPDAV